MIARFSLVIALLFAWAGSCPAQPAPAYREPDLQTPIFGGNLRLDGAERQATATLLARYVRNEMKFTAERELGIAAKLLGIALRLDPANKQAVVVNGVLKTGRKPTPDGDPRWSRKECIQHIRLAAAIAAKIPNKPDQTLAAYLYSTLLMMQASDDDVFELEMLSRAGIKPDWSFAEPPPPATGVKVVTASLPPVALGPDTLTRQIRGLVTMTTPDGRIQGMVKEIIAAPGPASQFAHPRLAVNANADMRLSFDEAVRLAELRRAGVVRWPLELSFGDKQAPRDGGSLGAAFALLMLSATGVMDVASDIAVTGDITVDGKIRTVSGIGAKVRAAAVERCRCIAIPAVDAGQIGDMLLLGGVEHVWNIQVLSMATIDEAVALVRKDRTSQLVEAMRLFDELREECARKPPTFPAESPAKEKLARIRTLAPNHVSAEYLQLLAEKRNPQKMTLPGTLSESLVAIGPMRQGLVDFAARPDVVTQPVAVAARNNLMLVRKVADPAAMPFIQALEAYCGIYYEWAMAEQGRSSRLRMQAREAFNFRRAEVKTVLERLLADTKAAERLLRE